MEELTIEKLEAEISNDPLFVVDHALLALARCEQAETPDLMDLLAEAILAHLGKPTIDGPVDSLFDQALSQQDRRFIAVCLLRLLSANDFFFGQDSSFRVKAFVLFDDVLSKDIYEQFEVARAQQTFQKQMRLRDVATEAESVMQEVVASRLSLDRLVEFQEQLMRAINNPLVKAVVWPFLPRPLLYRSRLAELFDAVRRYHQAPAASLMEVYGQAHSTIEQYLAEVQACGTFYCQHYLAEAAKKLEQALAQAFASSEVGRPAELEVKPAYKRYPFHQAGRDLNIGFEVENRGPGYAIEVELQIGSLFDDIVVRRATQYLGQLEPGSLIVDFPAQVVTPQEMAMLAVSLRWRNTDGSLQERAFEFELKGQRTDIDWAKVELEDPYSLEPVEMYDDLVGRRDIISQLVRQSCAKSVGSSYVYGQKRVGKTSIAKALRSHLEQQEGFLVIYLEGGEYFHPDPEATLSRLGTKLCEEVKRRDQRLADLPVPEFSGALYPLTDFLEAVHSACPESRILFILDEFDEIPVELYRRGPLGDSFFLTLRTVSGKPWVGFMLVGGERIDFIKSCQGDTLNKFREILVDYFDKEEHWADYQELVRRPTKHWLEMTDDALLALHEQTAGNPYFTMCICRELVTIALTRRDHFVTKREVVEGAAPLALKHIGTGFYHFWEDGIFEPTGDKVEEISIRRRRVLLALASVLREHKKAGKEQVAAQDVIRAELDESALEYELRRLVQRRVLVEDNGLYDCKVPLFRKWLKGSGVRAILTTFSDLDTILERRQKEEDAYVQSEEIVRLLSGWELYKGVRITEDRVRDWLAQFGDYINQRLMFRILEGLAFYSDDRIRTKLREAHGIVRRGLVWHRGKGQRKRGDILISYLDSPGKSGGGRYAKLYADENDVYYENVVERSKLAEVVSQRKGVQAIIFIDDFIGTGESAQAYIKRLVEESGEALRKADLKLYFIAVAGFQESQKKIEKVITECDLPIEVHICDPLDSSVRCFGEDSCAFPDEVERLQAMRVAHEHGARVVRENPLGYGDCQTAVVFSESCPNNNLPILWAESSDPPWRPLFKRPAPRRLHS